MAGKIFTILFWQIMACNSVVTRGYIERRLMWDNDPELGDEADDEMRVSWVSRCDRDLMSDPLQTGGADNSPKKRVRFHCTMLEQVRFYNPDELPNVLVRFMHDWNARCAGLT